MSERGRPGLPLFALLLIAAGLVLLLQNLGLVTWGLWLEIWRLWPVLLIAVGVSLIFGRRLRWVSTGIVVVLIAGAVIGAALLAESGGRVAVDHISRPLDGTRSLDVSVAFGGGNLTIDSLPDGSPSLFEGTFESRCQSREVSFRRDGDAASLDVEREYLDFEMDPAGLSVCPWDAWDADWRLSLSRVPEATVDLGTSAAAIDLDLTDLRVESLYVDAGASSIDIRMPANAGEVEVVINAGAASIDVWIPEGVEAHVVNDTGVSSFDVSSRFPSISNRAFRSPGYQDAGNRIYLEVTGGVSSVSVR